MLAGSEEAEVSCARNDAWDWQPLDATWYERVRSSALSMEIDRSLEVDLDRLRAALVRACDSCCSWLIHPALSILGAGRDDPALRLDRELLLAVWIAANCPEDFGTVLVPRALILWTSNGPRLVAAGRHELAALAREVAPLGARRTVDLDPIGAALGATLDDAWVADEASDLEAREAGIRSFFAAISLIETALPEVAGWVSRVTKVVVPLRIDTSNAGFRSSSPADVPGLVRMDVSCGSLRIFESLVHESAHRYFYHLEVDRPLVSEAFSERRFPSPLKRAPRPLRSVLLAFHALAYICAGFRELRYSEFVSDREVFERELEALLQSTQRAGETCSAAASCLTPHGASFLERVKKVESYAASR